MQFPCFIAGWPCFAVCEIKIAAALCVCFTVAQVLRPVPISEETMHTFHTKEYISFLKNVTPENQVLYTTWYDALPGGNCCTAAIQHRARHLASSLLQ